jgi:hypothetical protein
MRSPLLVEGDSALKAAVLLPWPVPPAEIGIDPVSFDAAREVIQEGFA